MRNFLLFIFALCVFSFNDYDKEVHWDWKDIKFDAKELAQKYKRLNRNFVW